MAKFCPQCGRGVSEVDEDCPTCGSRLPGREGVLRRLWNSLFGRGPAAHETTIHLGAPIQHAESWTQHFVDDHVEFTDPDGIQHVFDHLDAVPESMREVMQRVRDKLEDLPAEGVVSETREFYSYRDHDGVEQTFTSLDEMPPKVRRMFEAFTPTRGV